MIHSNPTTFEEALDVVLSEMRTIMIDRQRKYGPDNIKRAGMLGILQRAEHDKIGRVRRVYERDELRIRLFDEGVPADVINKYLPQLDSDFSDESIEDAHIDAANYLGPISLMLRRGWWGLPFGEEE